VVEIKNIRSKVLGMADSVCEMLQLIEKGFMANKIEPLTAALEKEDGINELEKTITGEILEMSRAARGDDEKDSLSVSEQLVGAFERMGDEAANLVERIEIKVHENLLFSETGVAQFNETYGAMKRSAEMMRDYLKSHDTAVKERVIDNGFHVKELVERYRKEHSDRLVRGICTPMAANMYFDMLDFTGNLARHASNVVKLV
jgi:phosphate:Na+ symporter